MPRLVHSSTRHAAELREANDRELLAALAVDDESALDELVDRKTRPLMQLVYRVLGDAEEARDVVQVTFLRLWEHRRGFDDRWSPNTWIFRIASNLAIDRLRSRRSRDRSAEPVRHHLRRVAEEGAGGELHRLLQGEVMGIFRELARHLSHRQRVAFLLHEIEGLTSPEVAQVLGCKDSTVRNHLANARRVLGRELMIRYPEYAPGRAESS